jgi:hypothetical protein
MHSIDCYCEGEGGVNNDRKNEVLTMMMMMMSISEFHERTTKKKMHNVRILSEVMTTP